MPMLAGGLGLVETRRGGRCHHATNVLFATPTWWPVGCYTCDDGAKRCWRLRVVHAQPIPVLSYSAEAKSASEPPRQLRQHITFDRRRRRTGGFMSAVIDVSEVSPGPARPCCTLLLTGLYAGSNGGSSWQGLEAVGVQSGEEKPLRFSVRLQPEHLCHDRCVALNELDGVWSQDVGRQHRTLAWTSAQGESCRRAGSPKLRRHAARLCEKKAVVVEGCPEQTRLRCNRTPYLSM